MEVSGVVSCFWGFFCGVERFADLLGTKGQIEEESRSGFNDS